MMTLGSLFDGSGGFPLAGIRCGITPLWASEIEPYPIAVTRHNFAGMKHLGDITKINGSKIQPVDVITFGSPCQDLSVAGKRAGIHEGTRSNLFFEAIRIIREMREATHGEYPKYAVWENVHGAFSSAKGEDFRCVLEEFVCTASGEQISIPMPANGKWLPAGEIVGDGYSIVWRVLDAQYFPGTPQRRKRIYLVADFAGERAGKILFERDGLSGNPEPGEEARQGAADHAAGGVGGSDRVECFTNRGYPCGDVAETCRAGSHGAIPMIAGFMGGQGSKAGGLGYAEEVAPTLKAAPSGENTIPDVVYTAVCVGNGQLHNISMAEQMNTLDCMHDQQAVLTSGKPPRRYIVRRLTPLECCRLQGFPDGWGDIPQKESMTNDEALFWESVLNTRNVINGKPEKQYAKASILKWYNRLHTDSAEYKMWGNGIALPCALYVLEGIAEALY